MPKSLRQLILEYLSVQDRSHWVDLTSRLKEIGDGDLQNIRSTLMQMDNGRLIEFQSGCIHGKLGIHERLNPGDERNSLITLENIPHLNAKITDGGIEKLREMKAAEGRINFSAPLRQELSRSRLLPEMNPATPPIKDAQITTNHPNKTSRLKAFFYDPWVIAIGGGLFVLIAGTILLVHYHVLH